MSFENRFSTRPVTTINICHNINEYKPIGIVSKNRIGALRTLENILLWTILAAFSNNKKKRTALKAENTNNDPTRPPYTPIHWSLDSEQVDLLISVSESQSAL